MTDKSKVTKATKTPTKAAKPSVKAAPKPISKAAPKAKPKAADKDIMSSNVPSDTSFRVQPYELKESEEYMNETQTAHFKEILSALRVVLMGKIDLAVLQLKDEPKHFADLNDRASQEEEFNLELRARDREASLVSNIDEALKRLHEGEYGYCEECGVEIGLRRLEARPTATLCIDCKTLAEMRERQSGNL